MRPSQAFRIPLFYGENTILNRPKDSGPKVPLYSEDHGSPQFVGRFWLNPFAYHASGGGRRLSSANLQALRSKHLARLRKGSAFQDFLSEQVLR